MYKRQEQVRAIAEAQNLPTASRPESQEVCFTNSHAAFVVSRRPEAGLPGPIEDASGRRLGTHRGIAHYTVGQRKRLGLGGQTCAYQVLRIEASRRAVVVGTSEEAVSYRVALADGVWRLAGPAPVLAQVRYRGHPLPAVVTPGPSGLTIDFVSPASGLAPGQSVVLYQSDRVVGGGIVPAPV